MGNEVCGLLGGFLFVCFSFFKRAGTWSGPGFCDEASSPIVFFNIIKISAGFNKISCQALIRWVWFFFKCSQPL